MNSDSAISVIELIPTTVATIDKNEIINAIDKKIKTTYENSQKYYNQEIKDNVLKLQEIEDKKWFSKKTITNEDSHLDLNSNFPLQACLETKAEERVEKLENLKKRMLINGEISMKEYTEILGLEIETNIIQN